MIRPALGVDSVKVPTTSEDSWEDEDRYHTRDPLVSQSSILSQVFKRPF